jgi:hypothetical protein
MFDAVIDRQLRSELLVVEQLDVREPGMVVGPITPSRLEARCDCLRRTLCR